MWDGFNQRKFPRLKLGCHISMMQGVLKEAIRGTTDNVGVGGVCLIQNQPLERFSTCRIRLDLSKGQPPIECDARVVWVIPRKDPAARETVFDTGLEFVNLPAEESSRFQAYLKDALAKGFQALA